MKIHIRQVIFYNSYFPIIRIFDINNIEIFQKVVNSLKPSIEEFEKNITSMDYFHGYCDICNEYRTMKIIKPIEGGWCNLRNNIYCECGSNGRNRMVFSEIKRSNWVKNSGVSVIFEKYTLFYKHLKKIQPNLLGCEYMGDEYLPGSNVFFRDINVQHEDMMNLSFKDNSIDHMVHCDVIEHVPDYKKALTECYRVLKKNGDMLFTVPYYNYSPNTKILSEIINGKRVDY
jgi:SAM-dependent methyltransferase